MCHDVGNVVPFKRSAIRVVASQKVSLEAAGRDLVSRATKCELVANRVNRYGDDEFNVIRSIAFSRKDGSPATLLRVHCNYFLYSEIQETLLNCCDRTDN